MSSYNDKGYLYMKNVKSERILVFVIIFFCVLMLGAMALGENMYFQERDCLDSFFSDYKVLKDNHLFFSWNKPIPILGGA